MGIVCQSNAGQNMKKQSMDLDFRQKLARIAKCRADLFLELNKTVPFKDELYKDLSADETYRKYLPCASKYVTPTGREYEPKENGARVMVVLQDWASQDWLSKNLDTHCSELDRHGYHKDLDTNKTLKRLLSDCLCLERKNVYVTNAFPYIKAGGMSGSIFRKHLKLIAPKILLQEIDLIQPDLILALGRIAEYAVELCGKKPTYLPHPAAWISDYAMKQKWQDTLKNIPIR